MDPATRRSFVFLLFGLLLLPAMISGDSLWTDEGCTTTFVRSAHFGQWWGALRTDTTADSQMPLYTLSAWVFGKLFGTAEWQLRAGNLPWAVLGLTGAAWAGRRLRLPWLPLFLALQPFFWFYANEARPYILQMSLGWWLLAGMVSFFETEGQGVVWAWVLAGAGLVLWYATMLAPATLLALAAVMIWTARRQRWRIERRAFLPLGAAAVLAIPAAVYYFSTLARGAKGAQLWAVDAKYPFYVAYELSGLSGLGPSILGLREIGHAGLQALVAQAGLFIAPAVGAALLAALIFLGWRSWRKDPSQAVPGPAVAFVLAIVAGLFLVAAVATHKAFWARHFAAVFPFYVTALALLIAGACRSAPRRLATSLAVALALLYLSSSLSFRCSARHRKEDYRDAARTAQQALARGSNVFWVAGSEAGEYYHLPLTQDRAKAGYAFCPIPKHSGDRVASIDTLPVPRLIVLARPDAFDPSGAVRAMIAAHRFHLAGEVTGFRFYER